MDNYEARDIYEEREISLKDLFKIFKQGFWRIIITAVVAAVLAFGFTSVFIPRTYASQVKFYVQTKSSGEGASAELSALSLANQLVSTYIEMLDTNNFYDGLSDELDNKYSSSELSKMINFTYEQDTKTELFSATVDAASAAEAKIIADCVAEVAPGFISDLRNDSAELKIIDNPQIPSGASSTNAVKLTLLAFAAGFAIALIYVFAKELLDNKIKYTSELTEINGISVLSAIPDFDGKKIVLGEDSDAQPAADSTDKEAK